jgi:TonB family protein
MEYFIMKKVTLLLSLVLLLSFSAFAQANFSGFWELDKSKSKLDERMSKSIESQALKVSQTEKEFKVETFTKRLSPPEGGMMPQNGGGQQQPPPMSGGMMRGGGDVSAVYSLDGKENTIQQESPNGSIAVVFKAIVDKDGTINLSQTRTFNGQNGEMTFVTKEKWTLSAEGKTLTINRDSDSPRGKTSLELVFVKNENPETKLMVKPSRPISGGVLNGKATLLVKPNFPEEAKNAKASGAVNVEILIDEAGNVISAKAVSGNELLRAAAEEAAKASKFSPTMLSGMLVQVKGVVVYNFVL